MTLDRILHPTDFSDSAQQALTLGAGLAARFNASLHILHGDTLHAGAVSPEDAQLERWADTARGIFERARRDPSQVTVSRPRAVSAFESIMQVVSADRPDLIVMGTHGRTGVGRLLMGSTAEKVLRHANCDVLTAKADCRVASDGRFHKLLVPVDFSDGAGRGLAAARALRSDDTEICLLHVVEPVPPLYYAGNVTSRFDLDAELRERIENNLRDWSGDLPGTKRFIAEGSPAMEVIRVADDIKADLVVISTRGLTGVEHLLVGSVTERVCRLATVPVLAVR